VDVRLTQSDAELAAQCHRNNIEFVREQARWGGARGEVAERDGVVLFATATTFPGMCNGVVRVDPDVPADEVIDLADRWFAERDRGYTLIAADLGVGADADLVAAAEARGLLLIASPPAMVCEGPLDPATLPAGIEARWVGDGGRVEDFVAVSDAAYQSLGMPAQVIADLVHVPATLDRPHLRTVVLHDGGDPVATAQILLSHGMAGVYYVGTVEAARGRGLAELVTRLVTNRAFDLGAPAVTLQASSMGERIYRRMGYRDLYGTTAHTRFPAAPA
jgi:ribosomal protein S18 acetylase RimI-like enzyme